MSIESLDGILDHDFFAQGTKHINLSHKSRSAVVRLGPNSITEKWKSPKTGFYTPTDVSFVVVPHISENAGVMATVKLVDESNCNPITRVLYRSQEFNLGHGLTLEGTQLPFCLPVGEYPIQFEVTVSRSQYQASRTMFTTSLEWRMMWSPMPLSRVKSAFITAPLPVAHANQHRNQRIQSSGPQTTKMKRRPKGGETIDGGTVRSDQPKCVGSLTTSPGT
nr:MAG: putative movement protein [Tombusviridae sp.]